jgi:hypothetical protein
MRRVLAGSQKSSISGHITKRLRRFERNRSLVVRESEALSSSRKAKPFGRLRSFAQPLAKICSAERSEAELGRALLFQWTTNFRSLVSLAHGTTTDSLRNRTAPQKPSLPAVVRPSSAEARTATAATTPLRSCRVFATTSCCYPLSRRDSSPRRWQPTRRPRRTSPARPTGSSVQVVPSQ